MQFNKLPVIQYLSIQNILATGKYFEKSLQFFFILLEKQCCGVYTCTHDMVILLGTTSYAAHHPSSPPHT